MPRNSLPLLAAICALAPGAASIAAPPIPLPFEQDFKQPALPEGWTADNSPGTSVTFKDGFAILESPADRHAYIRRDLGADNVTATARIHDAASVYLVWEGGNFVGAGKVSPTPFARFQSAVGAGGKVAAVDHRGCHGPGAHLIRVQLGEDCIRFQYSNADAAEEWRTLRTIERTPEFAGAPRFVAVGKNLGVVPDDATLVNTDSVGRGVRGLIARIGIAATPAGALKMTEDERHWLGRAKPDPVQQLLAESDKDPTFEEVARFYPEMKFKREIVGVPGQKDDIGTDWLGRIDASPWDGPIAWFEMGEGGTRFADRPEDVKHRLLDGYVPIATLSSRRDRVDYEQTVFGWSEGFRPTTDLYTYVRLSAWAGGDTDPLPKAIALGGKAGRIASWRPRISPAGELDLFVRFKHPDPSTAAEVSPEEFESRRAEVEAAWRERLAKSAPFDLPDPRVDQAYRAWLAYSQLNADVVDGHLEVHDGAGFYDLMFGYSVSQHAMAVDQYRLPDYAADVIATQIHSQKPDGHYIQECGLPDHGGFVLGMATHYLITKDESWLRRARDPLIKGCDWILARRAEAPKEGMLRGLIKFRPYNDYNDPVFNYLGNILCCQGLEGAGQVLGDIGEEGAAKRYAAEGARYRKDILDSMDAATFVRDGVRMIPIEPDTRRLLKLSKYRGGEYYGLVASNLFETGFFPAGDPRGALYVNMLEGQGGLAAGVCEFQEGMDHAYAYGYLADRLRAGEPRKAILGLWSMMAYGMTRDTYSPVEVTLYKTGENHYTLPHTYSCTQQLRLLRDMLLQEEGDDLVIARGVPTAWLEPSKHIEVKAAPTLFGPLSYRIESEGSGTTRIHLDPPSRKAPREIRIHLRHPEGREIAGVQAPAGANVSSRGGVIAISGASGPLDLEVRFAEK